MKTIYKYFLPLCLSALLCCTENKTYEISNISYERIEITDSIEADPEIKKFIKPYIQKINKDMDSVLAYSPKNYSKKEGHLNTAIGNFMADAVFEQSQPVFKSRTGFGIDMVLLNYGGIRSTIPKGNITVRTAYEVMPFENEVVVVGLKGSQIFELIDYLSKSKRPHPISKLNLALNQNFKLLKATINNSNIDENKIYFVATNDYLYRGGDRMNFFSKHESVYPLDYKIRNILIDYFKKIDTLDAKIDDRFIQKVALKTP